MLYNTSGKQIIKAVSGSTYTGLQAIDGSYNGVLSVTNTPKGLYHLCGAYNIKVTTNVFSGWQAPDGSMYVIDNGDSTYTPTASLQGASGSPVLWTPANVGPSLAAWWDGSDAAKITFNSANVANWNDEKALLAASQATAVNQPGYSASALNGSLSFASGQGLDTAAVAMGQQWYVLMLAAPASLTGVQSMVNAANSTATADQYFQFRLNAAAFEIIGFNTVSSFNSASKSGVTAAPTLFEGVRDATNVTAFVNTVAGTPAAVAGTPRSGNYAFQIGYFVTGISGFTGSEAQIVVLSSPPSASLQAKLQGWACWKTGQQALLPASNVYSPLGTLHRPPYVSDP
jgi:hypothetical protein